MSEKHTPEPWITDATGDGGDIARHIMNANGHGPVYIARLPMVGTLGRAYKSQEANARRIVACVNACKGITTADLETMVASMSIERQLKKSKPETRGRKSKCSAQRDDLLAALRCAIKKAPELITVPSIRSAIENAEGGR